MEFFQKTVEWFISDSIKKDLHLYARSRMVASGAIFSWLMCIPVVLALLVIFHDRPAIQIASIALTGGGIMVWVLSLYIMRWSGSFNWCIHTLVGSTIISNSCAIAFSGGINSPVMVAMVIPPVLAAIFTTRRHALIWCCISSTACVLFYAFDSDLIRDISLIPESRMQVVRALFSVFACFLVLGMLYMYEAINKQLVNIYENEKEKLSSLAHYDDLTGLANRLQFNQSLEQAITHAITQHNKVALIYIDLDDFKPVNDTHGHEAGDQVLRIASQRMSQCVRAADTVARLGGDEFAIILDSIGSGERAEKIAKSVADAISNPMDILGQQIRIGASYGVRLFPDHADNAQGLINAADEAMYELKRNKKAA